MTPTSELVERVRKILLLDRVAWHDDLPEALAALDGLASRVEELERERDEALRAEDVAERYREQAEAFIAHQGMEYRFAEWCGGVANPASRPHFPLFESERSDISASVDSAPAKRTT